MNPEAYQQGTLPVSSIHTLVYYQYGNPDGEVILSLHGGPGTPSKPKHVKSFDLSVYRVVAFDQRGCGGSTPLGETKENTTQDLLADIEKLRTHLDIKEWYVTGASWGATLALVYAEAQPTVVKGLLLSSIFMARPTDFAWSFKAKGGIERLFPDVWEEREKFFREFSITSAERAAQELSSQLEVAGKEEAKAIAAGVTNWEANLFSTQTDVSYLRAGDVSEADVASVKIFLHYEAHDCFVEDEHIINQAEAIADIPAVLVHGRYDVLCPLDSVWLLKQKLRKATLHILPTSGHALTAEGNLFKGEMFRHFLDQQK